MQRGWGRAGVKRAGKGGDVVKACQGGDAGMGMVEQARVQRALHEERGK